MNNPIIAHRGWSSKAPENTLASIRLALDEEAIDMIEIDIHLSKDQQIVVCHDFTLERTSDGSGDVRDYTLEELKSLDFGGWFLEAFIGERMPILDEVLNLIDGKKMLMIEIKKQVGYNDGIADLLCERLSRYEHRNMIMIKSFDQRLIKKIHDMDGDLVVGPIIFGQPNLLVEQLEYIGASFVSVNYSFVDEDMVEEVMASGRGFYTWAVDKPIDIARIRAIDRRIGIITNRPQNIFPNSHEK